MKILKKNTKTSTFKAYNPSWEKAGVLFGGAGGFL